MIVKQIRLSNHAKERLSRLKGKTGIKNWMGILLFIKGKHDSYIRGNRRRK